MAGVVPRRRISDPRFVNYVFRHAVKDSLGWAFGSARDFVRRDDYRNLRLPFQLVEQRAIARIFGTLDDKIELNRRMNETLEAMARALFKSWFVDFDPVRAKSEGCDPPLPESIAKLFPDLFAITQMGDIPQGWDPATIGDLCKSIYSGGTPSTQNREYWNGEVPWLSSGETREHYVITTEKRITPAVLPIPALVSSPPFPRSSRVLGKVIRVGNARF